MSPVFVAVMAVIVIVAGISIWRGFKTRPANAGDVERRWPPPLARATPQSTAARVSLETQIAALAEAGLAMNAGVTVDDLLHSFPREEYEIEPWHCLLFMLGIEIERPPAGRRICDVAFDFDFECIEGPGSYVQIVRAFARIAGVENKLAALSDSVDLSASAGDVSYSIDGTLHKVPVRIDNDWADPDAVKRILLDLAAAGDGRRFWHADNGQAIVLFFLPDDIASRVNALTGDALQPLLP